MSARLILVISALAFSVTAGDAATASSASSKHSSKLTKSQASSTAKTRSAVQKRKFSAGRRIANGFVPPPPAFSPSILPEAYYYRGRTLPQQTIADEDTDEAAADKPRNPYAKYIYSREGEFQKPQARSGVTNWSVLR